MTRRRSVETAFPRKAWEREKKMNNCANLNDSTPKRRDCIPTQSVGTREKMNNCANLNDSTPERRDCIPTQSVGTREMNNCANLNDSTPERRDCIPTQSVGTRAKTPGYFMSSLKGLEVSFFKNAHFDEFFFISN